MKGLEQAVNLKSWPGNGEPAKAWGKLKKDPELWDEGGDTLIFFARGRPEPSFRIKSHILRDTNSDTLVHMLLTALVRSGTPGTPPGVSYKLYMDPPLSVSKLDVLRHHITTRNLLAFLVRKPLVGFTFYQALVDLHERLEKHFATAFNTTEALKSYLVSLGLVNVSNEPRAAAGLLGWSEDIQWSEGWRIAFVHCVDMWEDLNQLQESADISPATRAHVDSMHLNLQARINAVERMIVAFDFNDADWSRESAHSDVRAASDRFRRFLRQFYEKRYNSWPSKQKFGKAGWLNRQLRDDVQHDFTSLYEYCVDRKVTLKEEEPYSSHWRSKAVALNVKKEIFRLGEEDDEMLRVLRNFDIRNDNVPIIHPYPLLPGAMAPPAEATKKSVFKNKKPDRERESRVADAYCFASNARQVHRDFAKNALLEAFVRFEKLDQTSAVDPREARQGRWIIIYCGLQTMAGAMVGIPQLTCPKLGSYFLDARISDLPPSRSEGKVFEEGALQRSYYWKCSPPWIDDQDERHDRQISLLGPYDHDRSNSSSTLQCVFHQDNLQPGSRSSIETVGNHQLSPEPLYHFKFYGNPSLPVSDSSGQLLGRNGSLSKPSDSPTRQNSSIFTRFSSLKTRSTITDSSSLGSTLDGIN